MKNEEQALFQFGIPLSNRPRWQLFLLCSLGVFFGYLVYGVCQEYVYNRLQFSYDWYFITLVQGLIYVALIYFLNDPTPKNPWKPYSMFSAVLMHSFGFTKGSLFLLSCPAQIMFSCPAQIMLRSTEVYPVMIMWPFIPDVRRKYPLHEFISAILLVVGLILLTLADAQTLPNISVINVLMISGALIMDSFLWNLPEVMFNFNSNTEMEMLFCSVGFPFLISVIARGALKTALFSCGQQLYVHGVLVFETFATSAGQVFVLSLIAVHGAMTTAAMPLTKQHFCGLLLMSMGIIMKRLPENKPLPAQKTSPLRQTEKPSETEDNRFRIGTEEEEEKTKPLV